MRAERPGGHRRFRSSRYVALLPAVTASLLLLWATTTVGADERELRTYRILHREAADAAEAVRPLLSTDAGLSVYQSTNTVIVNDRPAVQKRVADAIRRFDTPPLRLRMSTVYLDNSDLRDLDLSMRWQRLGGGWGLGRFRGAETFPVRRAVARGIEAARVRGDRMTSAELVAGRDTEIWVRPRRQAAGALRRYLARRNYVHDAASVEELRAGLSVVVRTADPAAGRFRLELIPRISYRRAMERVYLELAEAKTDVTLRENEWMVLSGGTATGHDLLTLLFGRLEGARDPGFNFLVRLRRMSAK